MLGVRASLRHALVGGPLSIVRLRARGAAWLLVYLALCSAILYAVGRALVEHEGDVRRLLIDYVLPRDWRFAGDLLISRFFREQERAVLVNAAVGASLMVVQVLLFPVKEKLSASFEREARLVGEPGRSLPLLVEAWEEVKLFLAFLAAQGCIFWLGYSQDPTRRTAAAMLSHGFLIVSFGIDFLTPVLQRHGHKYATTLKVLVFHPVLLVAFGALFTLPPVLVGRWILAHPGLPLAQAIGALFAANVLCVAWAAVAGTYCGAQLLPDARRTAPPARATRALASLLLFGLLGWNAWRFGAVGWSLHHKSQILKCEYDLDWTSLGIDRPGVLDLVGGLRRDVVQVGVHFDVTIRNPTGFDVEVEHNRIEIAKDGRRIAGTRLTPLRVPAGGETRVRMAVPLELTPSQLARGTDLLRAEGWTVTLWLEVAPGFEFPIYLM